MGIDLLRLIGAMNEHYVLKDGVDIGEGETRIKIRKMARLLPLGIYKGKDLSLTKWLEKMEEIKLPADFVFGIPKGDCTRQKQWYMRHRHSKGMAAAGKHLTTVIASLEELFV